MKSSRERVLLADAMPAAEPRAAGRTALAYAVLLCAFTWGVTAPDGAVRPLALVGAGLAWLTACGVAARGPLTWRALLLGFVLLRSVAWLAAPATSGDLWRYAWEAEVWLSGENPYELAPSAPALEPLAARLSALHALVEHAEIPAAYPPIAQLAFVAAALLARALDASALCDGPQAYAVSLRLLAVVADLAVLLLLRRWLVASGRPLSALVPWAWSPLLALEFAGAAHFDVLAIALALAALGPALGPPALRGALLALAAATKLLPAAFAPFAAERSDRARFLAAFFGVLALAAAPHLLALARSGHGGGLATYASVWESSSLLFRALERPLWPLLPSGAGWLDAKLVARALVAAGWLGILAVLVRRRWAPERAALVLCGAFLLLSPTFHPWYAAWAAPWLVLRRPGHELPLERALARGLTLLLALAPAQYVVLERWRSDGVWSEPAWLAPLMFGPALCLLLHAVLRPRAT